MTCLIQSKNEIEGLNKLLREILNNGERNGIYLEIESCLLSISFENEFWIRFQDNAEKYYSFLGSEISKGWNRATRVYTTETDKRTKPSYLRRIISYPDTPNKQNYIGKSINQFDSILEDFLKKPGYSCLSFVVLRPADLIDKFRPGYVPCLISGDFKFRNGKLNFNTMFRTGDALSVGYADILYLRRLQESLLNTAKEKTDNERILKGEIGKLNMYFSRAFIPKRIRSEKRISGINKAYEAIEFLSNI